VGQKVHPVGFRLNTTQKHKSVWYAHVNQYPVLLEQDSKIRDFINKEYEYAGVAKIQIERTYKLNNVSLKVYLAKPCALITESGNGLVKLNQQLKKLLPAVNKIHIDVFEVLEPDTHANLLAQFISNKLVRRVAFKRAIAKAIERAQAQGIKGIKIQVSGRLNGSEIARSECVKEGKMPLQTLRANIDYATARAKTIYGILGIKVWLYKGESV
ncbi:30S ribosomal protein S3, partial [Baffinella frigidus]|jgi:small subunit ribosomal protein S3